MKMLFLGMAAAANFAWVNRSSMTFLARQSFAKMFKMDPDDLDMHVIYDVSHNIAKFEEHTGINFGESGRQRGSNFFFAIKYIQLTQKTIILINIAVNGRPKSLLVHRKGSTRAFPPHHPLIPVDYQMTGQPVLIGGTMGSCSYVLTGTDKVMNINIYYSVMHNLKFHFLCSFRIF